MPYRCATWDRENDGYKAGPRFAPTLAGLNKLPGVLRREELHASLLHRRRVLLLTWLAVRGRTSTPVLARELRWELGHLGIVLRGMKRGGLVDCQLGARRPGSGNLAREWFATETGRWALWRLGWLTRSAVVPPDLAWDYETTVGDDPVDAVRRFVRQEFLTPASYVAMKHLIEQMPATMNEIARLMRVRWSVVGQRMRWWLRLGWLERSEMTAPGFQGEIAACWNVTPAGVQALLCHIDALRRAALACGWSPTPGAVAYRYGGNEYQYEEEFLRMGWSM